MKRRVGRNAKRVSAVLLSVAMLMTSISTDGLVVHATSAEQTVTDDKDVSQQDADYEKSEDTKDVSEDETPEVEEEESQEKAGDESGGENDTDDLHEQDSTVIEEETEEKSTSEEAIKEETTEEETEEGTTEVAANEIMLMSVVEYSDTTEYPTYVYQDMSNMPEELVVSDGAEEERLAVTWEVTEGNIENIGTPVTLKPVSKENEESTGFSLEDVEVELTVASPDMVYFIDAGTALQGKSEGIYDDIKDASESLINTVEDQEYDEASGWGYNADSFASSKGYVSGLGVHSTGLYGTDNGSKNPSYYVTLDAGTYELTTGHYEWWENNRKFQVVASYEEDGEEKETVIGTTSVSGKGSSDYVNGEFTVNEDDTLVKISVERVSGDAAVISYLAIEDTGKEIEKNADDDMLLHYTFEGLSGEVASGTTVEDISGNGNDATIKGAGAIVEDKVLSLPGGANNSGAAYVELPTGMFDKQETLTISVWLQNETGKGDYVAMFFGNEASTNNFPTHYWLLNPCNGNGYFKSVVTDGTNASAPYSTETNTSSTLTDSNWGLYTTVITEDSITGYYNGKEVSSDTKTMLVEDFGEDLLAFIGRSTYPDKFYKGQVKDVRVYTQALEAEEIQALYEEEGKEQEEEGELIAQYSFDGMRGNISAGVTIEDMSGNGQDAVIKGSGASVMRGALSLPGGSSSSTAAYMEIPGEVFENQETLTISLWLQNATGKGNYSGMFFGTTESVPTHYWLLNPCNPSGYFKSVLTDGTSEGSSWNVETEVSTTATDSGWGLYTTVITPDAITGYYNGKKVSTDSKDISIADFGTDLVSYIGKSSYADKFFQGQVKDIQIYNGVLSDEAIQEMYDEAFPEYPTYDVKAVKVEVDYDENEEVIVKQGEDAPHDVTITYDDGTTAKGYINWNEDVTSLDAGVYELEGTVDYFPYPLVEERADPDVFYDEDTRQYYFLGSWPAYGSMESGYDRIAIRVADSIEGIATAKDYEIWHAHTEGTELKYHIWAPELHKIGADWYIFYAGNTASNGWGIRAFVLKCEGGKDITDADNWEEMGHFKFRDGTEFDTMTLDMTYFENKGRCYVIWASKPDSSNLVIGEIDPDNPTQLISDASTISKPEYSWERVNEVVNEGPAVLKKNGKIYVTYSASATGVEYCVGLMEIADDEDLLNAENWKKYPTPVLTSDDAEGEYGPGHNSFTVDEDGNAVMIYHARDEECHDGECGYSGNPLYDPCRNALAKYVRYTEDGQPVFSSSAQTEIPDSLRTVEITVNVGNLTALGKVINGVEPAYTDDFESYEEGASASKGDTLTNSDGSKSIAMKTDTFTVTKENDNQYLAAVASSTTKLGQGTIATVDEEGKQLTFEEGLVMMDAIIPTLTENKDRPYAQIDLGNGDYFKFGATQGKYDIWYKGWTSVTNGAGFTYPEDTVVNLAVMLMDGKYTIYVDGEEVASYDTAQKKLGTIGFAAGSDAGIIDNVVIYDGAALKAAQNKDALARVNADLEGIVLYNLDAVRGNMTLPTVGSEYESTITWETSDAKTITTTGEVTRQDADQTVILTATVTDQIDSTVFVTKEYEATVLKLVGDLTYEDYLFAYFTGEGTANGEQIYFATSEDGLHWTAMNGGEPVITSTLGEKGLRDPFIIRSPEGDKFYLIATDLKINGGNGWTAAQESGSKSIMIWESTDLVNWSDQRMVEVAAEGAGCTWAPEAFYNDETGEYMVFWSSKIPSSQNVENNDYTHRVYYATTRDFYTFSEPQVWIELHNPSDQVISVIDATVIKVGDMYYRFMKNEANEPHRSDITTSGKYTILMKSDSLLGDWEEIPSAINSVSGVEGGTCFKFNDDDTENGIDKWCLLLDNHGNGGYYPLTTYDLSSGEFTKLNTSEYSFPSTMRHGTVINITDKEYQAVQKAYNPDYEDYSFEIDGTKANTNEADAFKGIGAVTANNSSRLLMDYKSENPEAYWEIMNTLFNKETGAGLSYVKVELGSDVNSSSGTEPASMRSADEEADATRGAGWMFAADAKSINPEIQVDALRWGEPAWIDGDYAARYQWYIKTLKAVYDEYGLKLDYLSADQNETASVDPDWIKYLANGLNNEANYKGYDFSEIKLVASDEIGSYNLPAAMMEDEELRDAVDAIGIHYTTKSNSNMLTLNEEYNKELFYSEGVSPTTPADESAFYDGSGLTGTNGALDVANRFINSYYNGSMVLYEYQPSVAAYYEGAKYFPKQILTANTPWSGYYKADIGVWTTAHFMQFIDAGWQYIDGACFGDGTENQTITPGSSTNNYLTLTDPETGDYTIVATNDSASARTYRIRVANVAKADSKLKMIQSIGPNDGAFDENWFKCTGYVTPEDNGDNSFTIKFTVKPYSIVTLTTLLDRGPEEGKSGITQSTTEDSVLTLPYEDDFEYEDSYLASRGNAPRYTTDQGGAFEVTTVNGNKVLEQKITSAMKPDDWRYRYTPNPYTMLGDDRWANYTVSVDVKLDNSSTSKANYAGVGARHITTNYSDNYANSGYQLVIYGDGTWALIDINTTVKSGAIKDFDSSAWYNLAVECKENRITAYINSKKVTAYTDQDTVTATGKVSLMSGYFNTLYDNLQVTGVDGHAYTATKRVDNFSNDLTYEGSFSHSINAGYSYYGRTITTGTADGETSISHTTTGNSGTKNAFYYYKADGSTWGSNSDNAWSGEAGSYYEITFEGTGIELLAYCNSSNGDGTVYIDGEKAGSLSCYSESSVTKVVFSKTGLSGGTHVVKVVVDTDGGYVSAAGATVLNESGENTTLSFDFTGTGFDVIGAGSEGTYNIYIDGELLEAQTATSVSGRQAAVMVRDLANKAHTARVAVIAGTLKVDAVEFMGEIIGVDEEAGLDMEVEDALFDLRTAVESYALTDEQKATYSPSSLAKFEEAYEYAKKVSEGWGDMTVERITSYYNKLVTRYEGLQAKGTPVTYTSFTGTNGETWLDTDGTEIQAHGGQVLPITKDGKTTYYWYGEDKTDGYRTVDGGVRVYSSTDLYNWKAEGIALRDLTDIYDFEEDYFAELYKGATEEEKQEILLGINDTTSVLERPKVIYNAKNDNYVMWFHADGPTETSTSNYAAASAGVAVSDSPTGPFKYLGRYRLHYVNGAYDSDKGMARDMNLFVDDDGTAYIIYSSEQNQTMFISQLNDDYTALAVDADEAAQKYDQDGTMLGFNRIPCYVGEAREAPALFKYKGTYYLMTSGCTGWGANAAKYAMCTGDSPLNSWTDMGNPCVTDTSICKYAANLTFGTQSTSVIPVNPEKGEFIYMGDRWNNTSPAGNELIDPKYVWLPIQFNTNGEMIIHPKNDWTLDDLGIINYAVSLETELPEIVERGNLASLPSEVTFKYADVTHTSKVTWKVENGDLTKAGAIVTCKGTLVDFMEGKTTISKEVLVVSEDMLYLIDCGIVKVGHTSAGYELAASRATLKNAVADAEYDETTGWGYDSSTITGTKDYGQSYGMLRETGYYGDTSSKNVTYYVTLDAGNYDLVSGHYEWWNTSRRLTDVIVSYTDADGSVYSQTIGTVSFGGTLGEQAQCGGSFTVAENNTKVAVTFAMNSNSIEAGTVGYFAVSKAYVASEPDDGDDEQGGSGNNGNGGSNSNNSSDDDDDSDNSGSNNTNNTSVTTDGTTIADTQTPLAAVPTGTELAATPVEVTPAGTEWIPGKTATITGSKDPETGEYQEKVQDEKVPSVEEAAGEVDLTETETVEEQKTIQEEAVAQAGDLDENQSGASMTLTEMLANSWYIILLILVAAAGIFGVFVYRKKKETK